MNSENRTKYLKWAAPKISRAVVANKMSLLDSEWNRTEKTWRGKKQERSLEVAKDGLASCGCCNNVLQG